MKGFWNLKKFLIFKTTQIQINTRVQIFAINIYFVIIWVKSNEKRLQTKYNPISIKSGCENLNLRVFLNWIQCSILKIRTAMKFAISVFYIALLISHCLEHTVDAASLGASTFTSSSTVTSFKTKLASGGFYRKWNKFCLVSSHETCLPSIMSW